MLGGHFGWATPSVFGRASGPIGAKARVGPPGRNHADKRTHEKSLYAISLHRELLELAQAVHLLGHGGSKQRHNAYTSGLR